MAQADPNVLRTNFEFSCDMPYDEIDDVNPQPGGTVAAALGEILKGLGCTVGEVIDGGDHGWYLDFSYRSVSPKLEVTVIYGIIVQVHGPRLTGLLGGAKPHNPDYVEILTRLGEAIQADPRFHDLGWFTKDEILEQQVGALTPLSGYSDARCVRYFGPRGEEDKAELVAGVAHERPHYIQPAPALLRKGWADVSPHPFRRWAARMFDTYMVVGSPFIVSVAVGLWLAARGKDDWLILTLVVAVVLLPLRMLIGAILSAFLISRTSTTPGKWICGIKIVREDGAPISFGLALKREAEALIAGCAIFLPLICWVAMAYNGEELRTKGETSWDGRRGLIALQRPNGPWQSLVAAIAVAPIVYGWFAVGRALGAFE